MKIFLQILQILLSLWNIIGGAFMISNYSSLGSSWALNTLPESFWLILGVVQILLSIGLLISIGNGALRKLANPSAISLAVITILGLVLYSAYNGFPGVLWAIIPACLLIFIAHKRKVTSE